MWLSKLLAAAIIVTTLGGCGFQPLYGKTAADKNVPADFSAVAIAPIPDRVGQELRNHLLDMLNPRGRPRNPAYTLNVRVDEDISDLAIDNSGLATRANLRLDAKYALVKDETGQSVVTGASLAVSSYNLVKADFSNLTAQNDARSRATLHIARQIRARLGAYFAQQLDAALGPVDD
jgi:LPS-assembly lipoprotein